VQNSLYVQVVHYPIYAALLHGTPAAGVSQTLRRGTRNVITELSQRAPPIPGLVAITLGIDPHSSYYIVYMLSCSREAEWPWGCGSLADAGDTAVYGPTPPKLPPVNI